tara:strand:+ start:73 stop:687 length:615 start_codon:yes stop_codon:yes gene_type:complete
MNIEIVIFDLDGVLVDACEWHRAALNEALMEVCGHEISLEEHHREYNGIPTRTKLAKLSEKGILAEAQHEKVYAIKQQKTVSIIESTAPRRQEKIDLLLWLKKRGVHIACCTNSIRKTTELMLIKTGIRELFDLVITNQDVEQPKPNPEGYIKILKHFKINKENAIIVEDSPKGLEAAYASGCNVIPVKNPEDVDIDLFKDFIE